MTGDGFIDLRVHGRHGAATHTDDSVWPSFTDIMTVVVMIFLMSLVVILIRNVELVEQLTETAAAERRAAEQALSEATQRVTLEKRLDQMERQIADIRLRLLQTQGERDVAARELEVNVERVRVLQSDLVALELVRARLLQERDRLMEENRALGADYESATQSITVLEREKQGLVAEIAALQERRSQLEQLTRELAAAAGEQQRQIAALQQEASAQSSEFDLLRTVYETLKTDKLSLDERAEALERDLALLRQQYAEQGRELAGSREQLGIISSQYSALELEYQRLIGLARSDIGRIVVRIRYSKNAAGDALIQLSEPDAETFQAVSPEQLEARLAALAARHPGNLYTRVIIPDDSGLSYTEAWEFTRDILQRYDYYYPN